MGFSSTYGNSKLNAPLTFEAKQFHWHQGSEHTIDDVRFDLEIHTVHLPDTSLVGSDAGNGS